MGLAIDVDKVTHVLLSDGWHEVIDESFTLDAYEYVWNVEHPGGSTQSQPYLGLQVAGFEFKDGPEGTWLAGPLTSIIAVRRSSSQ